MRLKNKIALITGASRGIGKATALLFAKEGAKVVVNYVSPKKEAELVVAEIKKMGSEAIAIKCDVSKENEVKKLIDQAIKAFGRIDILVNNAGTYFDGDEWDGPSSVWEKTLKNNLISAMITSKIATKIFQKQKSGIIINVASRQSVQGRAESLAYAASKAGIVNITQAYAKLLAPFGRVNAISPWPTRSGYWIRAPKDELDQVISKMPAKRLIEPEEVASVILKLASDESKYLTGQNILMNGLKLEYNKCFGQRRCKLHNRKHNHGRRRTRLI